jgi:hypothetical protein
MNTHQLLISLIVLALCIEVVNMGFSIYFYNNQPKPNFTDFKKENMLFKR